MEAYKYAYRCKQTAMVYSVFKWQPWHEMALPATKCVHVKISACLCKLLQNFYSSNCSMLQPNYESNCTMCTDVYGTGTFFDRYCTCENGYRITLKIKVFNFANPEPFTKIFQRKFCHLNYASLRLHRTPYVSHGQTS